MRLLKKWLVVVFYKFNIKDYRLMIDWMYDELTTLGYNRSYKDDLNSNPEALFIYAISRKDFRKEMLYASILDEVIITLWLNYIESSLSNNLNFMDSRPIDILLSRSDRFSIVFDGGQAIKNIIDFIESEAMEFSLNQGMAIYFEHMKEMSDLFLDQHVYQHTYVDLMKVSELLIEYNHYIENKIKS